jgi:hypothetical protein
MAGTDDSRICARNASPPLAAWRDPRDRRHPSTRHAAAHVVGQDRGNTQIGRVIRRRDVIDAELSDVRAELETTEMDKLGGGAANPDRRVTEGGDRNGRKKDERQGGQGGFEGAARWTHQQGVEDRGGVRFESAGSEVRREGQEIDWPPDRHA